MKIDGAFCCVAIEYKVLLEAYSCELAAEIPIATDTPLINDDSVHWLMDCIAITQGDWFGLSTG